MSCESVILGSNKTLVLDKPRGEDKQVTPEINRGEFLEIKPVRNSALRWEKDQQGIIMLFVPLQQPQKKGRKSILSMLSSPPLEKKIRLDSVGSIVWELCDGEKTVRDIIQVLQEKHKMLQSEAELSLNTYFNLLSKRGLMGFIVPEETHTCIEETAKKEKKQ